MAKQKNIQYKNGHRISNETLREWAEEGWNIKSIRQYFGASNENERRNGEIVLVKERHDDE